ncbi:hypothetical protein C7N83_03390 [Neisseria iguanae]|uniref:Uncharacterized protein n=1 Tax=Neisseria iguanae TaxID=90242 RepID=A0A2P7U1T4_9NEIS|nr:hypothetical protein C7N83_03390 [Neisseria iguanae]
MRPFKFKLKLPLRAKVGYGASDLSRVFVFELISHRVLIDKTDYAALQPLQQTAIAIPYSTENQPAAFGFTA